MDILLQGEMDGQRAALKIRFLCKIPVIFVPALGVKITPTNGDVPEPQNYGYIVKPFTKEDIGSEIRRLCCPTQVFV